MDSVCSDAQDVNFDQTPYLFIPEVHSIVFLSFLEHNSPVTAVRMCAMVTMETNEMLMDTVRIFVVKDLCGQKQE
jgi:hypothetical protein